MRSLQKTQITTLLKQPGKSPLMQPGPVQSSLTCTFGELRMHIDNVNKIRIVVVYVPPTYCDGIVGCLLQNDVCGDGSLFVHGEGSVIVFIGWQGWWME